MCAEDCGISRTAHLGIKINPGTMSSSAKSGGASSRDEKVIVGILCIIRFRPNCCSYRRETDKLLWGLSLLPEILVISLVLNLINWSSTRLIYHNGKLTGKSREPSWITCFRLGNEYYKSLADQFELMHINFNYLI